MAFDNKGFGGGPQFEIPNLAELGKKLGGGGARWIAVAVLALLLLATSVYTVQPEEVAVILRLGRYVREAPPGLHLKAPLGIETVFKVPEKRLLKAEFGFRTVSADVRSEFATRGYDVESNMLTGDLNAAVVEWVVQYRINDAEQYLFRVRNVDVTLRDMSEAVMREVIGDRTVNEVITVGRQEIEDLVKVNLQALCDEYENGIRVDRVVLQDVTPPEPVKPSFNEVNQAEQERERLINEAQSAYNQVIPRAEGEARRTVQEAEGYALNRVNRAQGDASLFGSLYDEYRKAPEVTRQRMYLETMGEILPKVGRKLIIDEDVEGLVPLLNLDSGNPLPLAERGSQ